MTIMVSDLEVEAARRAFDAKSLEVEGSESGRALRICWTAALDAAFAIREAALARVILARRVGTESYPSSKEESK